MAYTAMGWKFVCEIQFNCQYEFCSGNDRDLGTAVAGSISAGVSEFFIDIKSFRSHYGPGIDSNSNRNEYQEYFSKELKTP